MTTKKIFSVCLPQGVGTAEDARNSAPQKASNSDTYLKTEETCAFQAPEKQQSSSDPPLSSAGAKHSLEITSGQLELVVPANQVPHIGTPASSGHDSLMRFVRSAVNAAILYLFATQLRIAPQVLRISCLHARLLWPPLHFCIVSALRLEV